MIIRWRASIDTTYFDFVWTLVISIISGLSSCENIYHWYEKVHARPNFDLLYYSTHFVARNYLWFRRINSSCAYIQTENLYSIRKYDINTKWYLIRFESKNLQNKYAKKKEEKRKMYSLSIYSTIFIKFKTRNIKMFLSFLQQFFAIESL